eukprot:217149_1
MHSKSKKRLIITLQLKNAEVYPGSNLHGTVILQLMQKHHHVNNNGNDSIDLKSKNKNETIIIDRISISVSGICNINLESEQTHFPIHLQNENDNFNILCGKENILGRGLQLELNKNKYESIGQLKKDIKLLWNNCYLFNGQPAKNGQYIFSNFAAELEWTLNEYLKQFKHNLCANGWIDPNIKNNCDNKRVFTLKTQSLVSSPPPPVISSPFLTSNSNSIYMPTINNTISLSPPIDAISISSNEKNQMYVPPTKKRKIIPICPYNPSQYSVIPTHTQQVPLHSYNTHNTQNIVEHHLTQAEYLLNPNNIISDILQPPAPVMHNTNISPEVHYHLTQAEYLLAQNEQQQNVSYIPRNDIENEVSNLFYSSVSKEAYSIIDIVKITTKKEQIYEQIIQTKCETSSTIRSYIEKNLWHGSRNINNLNLIYQNGFDRSYNTRKRYGSGTYFAKNASYSVNGGYCGKDKNGIFYILLCKVIVGDYIVGNRSMKQIPRKSNGEEYDSMVNTMTNPTIFVIVRDYHALPFYLVKYIPINK